MEDCDHTEKEMKISKIEANGEDQNNSYESLSSKIEEIDDQALRRFLRARGLDVEKASAMFLKYLKWRKEFVPNGFISPSQVPNEIAQNKMFLQGICKKGRPIGVLLGARHFQIKILDEFKRFVFCTLHNMCQRMPPGQEKFVVIAHIQGRGYANCDLRAYLAALTILQDCYPERLGKLFIVNVPNIFMAVWKIVYHFTDNNTRKKSKHCQLVANTLWLCIHLRIVFVENKNLKSTFLEDIDESQIPETYGGQMPLFPILESDKRNLRS